MNIETLTARTPSGLEVIFSVNDSRSGVHPVAAVPARNISGQVNGSPLPIPVRDGATHRLAIGVVFVGFDDVEAAEVGAWLGAARAAIAATPDATRRRLEGARRDLCLEIQAGHEDAQAANERAWQRGDESAAIRRFDDSALLAKLAEFDRRHPEIVEAIRAEKAEALRRFQAAD